MPRLEYSLAELRAMKKAEPVKPVEPLKIEMPDTVWNAATRSLTVTGLSAGDAEKLLHIWRLLGLDSSNPVTTTTAAIAATDIDVVITGNGETSTTLTRT